jgi:hypothetical protein
VAHASSVEVPNFWNRVDAEVEGDPLGTAYSDAAP